MPTAAIHSFASPSHPPALSNRAGPPYYQRGCAVCSALPFNRHDQWSDTGFTIPFVPIADAAAPSDVLLIAGMAQGDEGAASALYDRHGAVMYGLALRMVGESADAEDVVLDAFAQSWRDASRYDSARGSVAGWLTTITRTRALDLIRARGRRLKVTDAATAMHDEPAAMGSGFAAPDMEVLETERAIVIKSALDQLPVPQRQAIELAFFEGLTHHEVADRLREPLGTIKTRIRLGMQKLRDALVGLAPESVS